MLADQNLERSPAKMLDGSIEDDPYGTEREGEPKERGVLESEVKSEGGTSPVGVLGVGAR